jgi:hypothetical protein
VIPAFLSFGLISFGVSEPERPRDVREVRSPLSLAELKRLGSAYWWITAIATIFTLARFSEAFLLLKAQSVGLPLMLIPIVMVAMNVVYALSAYPVGILSDRLDRMAVLFVGLALLVAADIALGLSTGFVGLAFGVVFWGLHMGFTQGLLAASVIAGELWDTIGPSGTFLAGAAFTAIAIAGLFSLRGRIREARAVVDGSAADTLEHPIQ